MNETIEINEDNCVLDDSELGLIDTAFNDFIEKCGMSSQEWANKESTSIFLKIQKLNDLAKRAKKG